MPSGATAKASAPHDGRVRVTRSQAAATIGGGNALACFPAEGGERMAWLWSALRIRKTAPACAGADNRCGRTRKLREPTRTYASCRAMGVSEYSGVRARCRGKSISDAASARAEGPERQPRWREQQPRRREHQCMVFPKLLAIARQDEDMDAGIAHEDAAAGTSVTPPASASRPMCRIPPARATSVPAAAPRCWGSGRPLAIGLGTYEAEPEPSDRFRPVVTFRPPLPSSSLATNPSSGADAGGLSPSRFISAALIKAGLIAVGG